MTDNVVGLKIAGSNSSPILPEDSYLKSILDVLKKHEIIDGLTDTDVGLEPALSNELLLGPLTTTEKTCFITGMVLHQLVKDELVEAEAMAMTRIVDIMHDKKIPMAQAQQIFARDTGMPTSTLSYITLCTMANHNLMSMYEWGLRSRYSMWSAPLIIRAGYRAFTYE